MRQLALLLQSDGNDHFSYTAAGWDWIGWWSNTLWNANTFLHCSLKERRSPVSLSPPQRWALRASSLQREHFVRFSSAGKHRAYVRNFEICFRKPRGVVAQLLPFTDMLKLYSATINCHLRVCRTAAEKNSGWKYSPHACLALPKISQNNESGKWRLRTDPLICYCTLPRLVFTELLFLPSLLWLFEGKSKKKKKKHLSNEIQTFKISLTHRTTKLMFKKLIREIWQVQSNVIQPTTE